MALDTPAETPAGEEYTVEHTARASERFTDVLPAAYDDKDDMDLLQAKLQQRKKPIYAGLAFLCVVVIGVSIAVSSGGSTTDANTGSGVTTPEVTPEATQAEVTDAGGVHAAGDVSSSGSRSGLSSLGSSGSGSVAGENEDALLALFNSSTPEPTTEAPTPSPTDGPILPFHDLGFNWKDPGNWEYSGGGAPAGGMVTDDGIRLTSANSPQPIRTKVGWGGEKIVLVEWERSGSSDTNIWMLNTKIRSQFGANNGWPYYGELDIFEMFTQDKITQSAYDFSGFVQYGDVSSYGQLTLHNGPRHENGPPCFCPSSASKGAWFQNSAPMTSGCTAQFSNDAKNSIATIWGTDGNGQYLQLMQNPTITKGGKLNGQQTFDIAPGSGAVTSKIYNNAGLFWGTPSSSPCASAGGHNPATGFPFFEDFYLILEEQKKNDGGAWFKVNNIQIFKKN